MTAIRAHFRQTAQIRMKLSKHDGQCQRAFLALFSVVMKDKINPPMCYRIFSSDAVNITGRIETNAGEVVLKENVVG